jgi:hypothetical protein
MQCGGRQLVAWRWAHYLKESCFAHSVVKVCYLAFDNLWFYGLHENNFDIDQ